MKIILHNTIYRLKQFIDYNSISIREFLKRAGISHGLLRQVRTIGSDKLKNILSTYTELNPEWFLTGHGEMLKNETAETTSDKASVSSTEMNRDCKIKILKKRLDDKITQDLENQLTLKGRIIETKDEFIKRT
ncbi:hypothetical protein [Bacteroidetes bacterium endosymbiont of Geopemphigus sp.]|uniref:hypothetical protein n=1 Tax=Bacteroidetes bacterium endosymbiont of Geopemphigus sp. TaxID=2047937 RepID=UPI0011AF11B4|nr:hypothetical protein [Bacteroidetes bacterium endosymbiont of Geopemphigus sp.]